jgi:hypothetical protein
MKLACALAFVVGSSIAGAAGAPGTVRAALAPLLADPGAAIECQTTLVEASGAFAQKKLKLLDACHAALFRCVQVVPPDDVDAQDRCLEKADARCVKAGEKSAAEEEKLTARIADACAGLDPLDFMRADGMNFDAVAAECAADWGVTVTGAATAAQCVTAQQTCEVERLFETMQPRAGELFALTATDLGACLEDFGGLGDGAGEPRLGKAVDKCGQAIRKSTTAFAGRKGRGLGQCLGAVFGCLQRGNQPACVAKATAVCDKAFAGVEAEALKLEPAYLKACGAIDFAQLAPDTGLFTEALAEQCEEVGILFIGSLPSYKNCVHRRQECQGDAFLRLAVPRAAELLASIGRPYPGKFFCPVEEE